MIARSTLVVALLLLFAAAGRAQDARDEFRMLELRVSGTGDRAIVMVDRGARDGLAVGDAVRFHPREGGPLRGTVVRVVERSAMVEIDGDREAPPLGTRGEVRIPVERAIETGVDPPELVPEVPEHPPWENTDEEYTPGMPLLVEVDAVRPEDRAARISGRVYVTGDWIQTLDEDRRDYFLRMGTDVRSLNPFGRGGELHFDAEMNFRRADLPDLDDENASELRIDRISYERGGTRFSDTRFEVGRFLQEGMYEFGVIDGYEYAKSSVGGDAVGFSLGFMPEPDPDFQSGKDFQLAAWYHWEPADFSALTVDGGYQKTFHNGDADRDLFVLRLANLPDEGWDVHGTAWIDLYTSGDDKDAGVELTQANLVTSRRFGEEGGLDISLTLTRFPDIERDEFLPPEPLDLLDDENKRLGTSAWKRVTESTRVIGIAGVWADEEDEGGDVEVGLEIDDFLLERSVTSFSVFDNHARFTDIVGARAGYRIHAGRGYWDLSVEAARQRQLGFSDALDNLPRIRARGSWGFRTGSGWDVSLYGEGETWDEDHAWSVGFFAQRYF